MLVLVLSILWLKSLSIRKRHEKRHMLKIPDKTHYTACIFLYLWNSVFNFFFKRNIFITNYSSKNKWIIFIPKDKHIRGVKIEFLEHRVFLSVGTNSELIHIFVPKHVWIYWNVHFLDLHQISHSFPTRWTCFTCLLYCWHKTSELNLEQRINIKFFFLWILVKLHVKR